MIALICDSREAELYAMISAFDETMVFHQSGLITDYIRSGGDLRLIVVALDGARGMNVASRRSSMPVLWITEQEDFTHQSKRMGVAGFLVKPVPDDILRETIRALWEDDG